MWKLHFFQHFHLSWGRPGHLENVGIYVKTAYYTIVDVEFTLFPRFPIELGATWSIVNNVGKSVKTAYYTIVNVEITFFPTFPIELGATWSCWDLCKNHIIHYSKCGIYTFPNIITIDLGATLVK